MTSGKLGTNIDYTLEGTKLTMVIDLSEDHGKTGSGKNISIATTSGNTLIPGSDAKIGLNVFKKA